MNPISHPLHWKFQKNRHVLEALLLRNAPSFVYRRSGAALLDEIPVFTFHTAEPERFERQCRHLAENDYRSLSADEFAAALRTGARVPERSVLLTFDDGLKEVWTVAFPLLRKYGLQATCFLIPGVIPEDAAGTRPNLEDVWKGSADLDTVSAGSRGPEALCTWDEIRAMHETGVVQFESHTMYHGLVYTSDRLFDFVGPDYDPYFYANIHVPIVRRGDRDLVEREPMLGMPIFRARPRMSVKARFLDDEEIRQRCLDAVATEGAETFFQRHDWRRRLKAIVDGGRREKGRAGIWETADERDTTLRADLALSREIIEARLPGRPVTQVCWPWYEAGEFAVEQARRAGYDLTYFGQIRGRATNRAGDDPFHVVRVEEMFLERLPGRGRKRLRDVLREAYLQAPPRRPSAAAGASSSAHKITA